MLTFVFIGVTTDWVSESSFNSGGSIAPTLGDLGIFVVWFFFAFLAVPNSTANGEWHLLGYSYLATFFLVYVPFSKISHYLYYPFTRYYLGKSLGYRGVFPVERGTVRG